MARYIVEVEATGSAENLPTRPKQTDLKARGAGVYTFRRDRDGKMTTRQEVYENKNGNLTVRHLPMSEMAVLTGPELRRSIKIVERLVKMMPSQGTLLRKLVAENDHRAELPASDGDSR